MVVQIRRRLGTIYADLGVIVDSLDLSVKID